MLRHGFILANVLILVSKMHLFLPFFIESKNSMLIVTFYCFLFLLHFHFSDDYEPNNDKNRGEERVNCFPDINKAMESVSNELKDTEAKGLSLEKQIDDNQEYLEMLKTSFNRMRTELTRLQLSNQHAEMLYRENVEKKMAPKLQLPWKILPQQAEGS